MNTVPRDKDENSKNFAQIYSKEQIVASLLDEHFTDLGNAERFIHVLNGSMRYVAQEKSWYLYNGSIWMPDRNKAIYHAYEHMIQLIYKAAQKLEAKEQQARKRDLINHAMKSESERSIRSAIALAASKKGIPLDINHFDVDPMILNVRNGSLNLSEGALYRHQSKNFLTKMAGTHYDESAKAPQWEQFICRMFGGNRELIDFIQRAVGLSLTGCIYEQVLFLLIGRGKNGKSTFLEVLRQLLGSYAATADFSSFLESKSERVRNDLARLKGVRFVSAAEADPDRALSESIVKQITGGDTITARYLYKEYFEFVPALKMWSALNSKPRIKGTDDGIWRRVLLIPCDAKISDEETDPYLPSKLLLELPGILVWAVEGCLSWQKEGLRIPDILRSATREYREDEDIFGQFIAECCDVQADLLASSMHLFESYAKWCDRCREKPLAKNVFGERLKRLGLESCRESKSRLWKGIGLKDPGSKAEF